MLFHVKVPSKGEATIWTKVHEFFHEMKNYTLFDVVRIDYQSENSLNHRWYAIQDLLKKYCGAYGQIKNLAPSGMGVVDYVSFSSYKVYHMIYSLYVTIC